MLPDVHLWRIELRTLAPLELPPFAGPLLRGVLGNALFVGLGAEAGAGLFEPGIAAPRFRFDTPVQPVRTLRPGQRWSFRFVTFEEESAEVFLTALQAACVAGLRDNRAEQEIVKVTELAHGGPSAPDREAGADLQLSLRAEELLQAGGLVLRLLSPTELKRQGRRIRTPSTADVLHGAAARARALGIDLSDFPRFEEDATEIVGRMTTWSHARHSAAQGRDYGLVGVLGGIALRPTAAQAAWIALAEVLGVGASTAYGMGSVRAYPLDAYGD